MIVLQPWHVDAAIAGLVGTILGGTISLFSAFAMESYKRRKLAEQIAHAIAGEVLAVQDLVAQRHYVDALREVMELAKQGNPYGFDIRITKNYFATIEANLGSIGLLPLNLPLLIPKFLTLAKAIEEDIAALAEDPLTTIKADAFVIRCDVVLDLLARADTVAKQIVSCVATVYGSPNNSAWYNRRLCVFLWHPIAFLRNRVSR